MEKKIYFWEPYFFWFFGLFHLHRIWGLIDRQSYADFWMNLLNTKGFAYFAIMIVLAALCVLGIITFCKNLHNNFWWRWIYIFGGLYVLFDLFAIAVGLEVWNNLLLMMFDVTSPWWNLIWSGFVLLGAIAFVLGIRLRVQRGSFEQPK